MGKYFINRNTGKIDYEPSLAETMGSMLSGLYDNIFISLMGLVGFVVVGFVVIVFGAMLLFKVGILKTDVDVMVTPDVTQTEVQAVMISHKKKPKVYMAPVDESTPAKFKASTGNHSLFLSYDGMMYDYGSYIIPAILSDTNPQCTLEPSRAVLVTFLSYKNDQTIVPASFSITSSAGEVGWTEVGSGMYAFLLPENADGEVLTITVPGYETVTVAEDWESQRLGLLEVRLNAQ